jgi:Na+/H+ antiporter NhaD/arsenite permease-like protein
MPSPAVSAAVPLWLSGPFALLLLLIATMPLSPPRARHLWERFYPAVAIGLGLAVALFYVARYDHGPSRVALTVEEYVSFVALIGSLFVVAAGLHIRIRGASRPAGNVAFLLIGAVLSNAIGTTGASMVLIRPWIDMNRHRIAAYHTVFFIFVVSNVGGALTPIGDPPLFLGYLHGVPFFWLIDKVALPWVATLALLLAVFYVIDRRSFRRARPGGPDGPALRQPSRDSVAVSGRVDPGPAPAGGPLVAVQGLHNLAFLGLVIAGVFVPHRFFMREAVMAVAALASYRSTRPAIRAANRFTFEPIKEVAVLFAGIFLTMMPALDYLEHHGRELGFRTPLGYYVATGALSAVLDNAPTYLNFLTLAEAAATPPDVQARAAAAAASAGPDGAAAAREAVLLGWLLDPASRRPEGGPAHAFVVAVSLGAVFFGAMTYIGNGPNFMVKSIAEAAGLAVPTFFGYVFKFSLPILLPILVLVGWWCLP